MACIYLSLLKSKPESPGICCNLSNLFGIRWFDQRKTENNHKTSFVPNDTMRTIGYTLCFELPFLTPSSQKVSTFVTIRLLLGKYI